MDSYKAVGFWVVWTRGGLLTGEDALRGAQVCFASPPRLSGKWKVQLLCAL